MKSRFLPLVIFLTVTCVSQSRPVEAANKPLWVVGKADGDNAELAFAPRDYKKATQDGFFVVGASDAARDWPYVHPGPGDSWAGGKSHTFVVVFGAEKVRPGLPCQLTVDLLDTQNASPPMMLLAINGKTFEHQTPAGTGDASVFGEPSKGKKHSWTVPFNSDLLRNGDNEITITTLSGSWCLYDAITLSAPEDFHSAPVKPSTRFLSCAVPSVWLKEAGRAMQPVTVSVRHIGSPAEVTAYLEGAEVAKLALTNGVQKLDLKTPATEQTRVATLRLAAAGKDLIETNLTLSPPRLREMWVLPHSHVDIGYTHRQAEIIDVQIANLKTGMKLARESAGNPEGARFKWNPEAVWSLDHFLGRAKANERSEFIKAVQRGDVGVDALYGNMLTALCRPEELAQCLAFGARISNLTGVPLETASICDVPGYTWGIVPVMAQAGVKYFAIGPNYSDRVGTIHIWDDKPFYWKSQSGKERLLCWVVDNYHHLGNLEENVLQQVKRLEQKNFPYDTSFIFWVGAWPGGGVDNAPPDEKTVEKVLAWNEKYAAPKVTIGLSREFFREFERRYRSKLPEFSGDLTPYWEDGAGSTARETAMNRVSADRLSQASTLFAMRAPTANPMEKFDEAWKNVLLYSEHTWGAHCSISRPDDPFTLDQWRVKGGFAVDADRDSRLLLKAALPPLSSAPDIDVFNTTQWERSDLAVVPAAFPGSSVVDDRGRAVPSQRLASGELAFLARDVPPFGARRYRLIKDPPANKGKAKATDSTLSNGLLTVVVDPITGAVKSLRLNGKKHEYVDRGAAVALNDFRYLPGTNVKGAQPNGPVRIEVLEKGPLVASLRITSGAPGCNQLVREVRVVDELDRVELVNHVDRESVRQKDGVHFGFGFNVPSGTVRMETPWAVVRPNVDQLPGSCRNWFTVQRWVDISGKDRGITWAPIDAPLMQIGGMTANLLGSVPFHLWMTNALESQTIYSWAQNNHWHTNYKIDQPGVTTFRYILRPHTGGYSAADSARFGLETTRPLVVASAMTPKAPGSLLTVSSQGVLVETLKVSDDRKALILRLFGISGKPESVSVNWKSVKPASVSLTDLTENAIKPMESAISIPAYGLVQLRADME